MRRQLGWILMVALAGCQSRPVDVGQAQSSAEVGTDAITASLNAPPNPRWTRADEAILGPVWRGDNDKGQLYQPLWRGGAPALEDYLYVPPDHDCRGQKGTVRIDWDKAANTVHVLVKYEHLPAHPAIARTDGENYFFNPFHQAPKDVSDGAYRFWIIWGHITGKPLTFYYDASTLKLLGSEIDYPNGPPPNVIPQPFPYFPLVCSQLFNMNPDGTGSHEFTLQYDNVGVEGGAYANSIVTLIPQDLCEAAPFQPNISQLRPYVPKQGWLPKDKGVSWDEVLKGGLNFDTTVDDATTQYPGGVFPYVYSGISFMSGAPVTQGGVPRGSYLSVPTVIQNVSPVIKPIPGGDDLGCQGFFVDPHVTAPRYCEMAH